MPFDNLILYISLNNYDNFIVFKQWINVKYSISLPTIAGNLRFDKLSSGWDDSIIVGVQINFKCTIHSQGQLGV